MARHEAASPYIHCRESAIKRRAAEILHQQQQLAEELQRLHEEEQQLVEASEEEAATEDAAKQDGPTQPADFQVQRDEAKAPAWHSLPLLMMVSGGNISKVVSFWATACC